MNGRRKLDRRKWGAIVPALALLLAGCSNVPGLDRVTGLFSSDPKAETSGTPTADAPVRFALGDRYTFDNPVERWEVVAIRGEKVYWRSDLGERQVTGFNPLLPPQEWFGRDKGKGRRLIRDKEGALFPLRVGAALKYRETVTTDRPPFGWEHNWTCRVTDNEILPTLGGSFETYVIKCGHERPDLITYRYAPKVGNYLVRRTKRLDGKPDSVRNLLSFERADGTVVAGIVAESPAAQAQTPTAAPASPREGQVPNNAPQAVVAPKNAVPSQTSAEPRPSPTSKAVNPRPGAAGDRTVPDAIAALSLSQPKFGGRAKPPVPLPRPVEPQVQGDHSPLPRPAPVTAVTKAAVPPPAPKPVVASPALKPIAPVRRPSRVPPPALGPRSASASAKLAPRARVPVPPPSKKIAPAVPAPRVPPPPSQTAAPAPRVPPPPIARAAPTVPPPPSAVPPPPSAVPPPPVAAPKVAAIPKPPPSVPPPPTVSRNTVHLASYRSNAAAEQGWTALKSENDDLLGNLKPQIKQIAVDGKGTFYRLYAGPVPAASIAGLCRKLNGRGVFCAPAG